MGLVCNRDPAYAVPVADPPVRACSVRTRGSFLHVGPTEHARTAGLAASASCTNIATELAVYSQWSTSHVKMASACVSDLLASAFSSSLSSSVVTYDQYKSDPKGCYQPLDIHQLFNISHLAGKIGERPCATQARDNIEVFINTLSGRTFSINVCKHDVVEDLKEKIMDKDGVPVDQQRIIFNGKQLQDHVQLSDYGIKDQCTIHLVLRLRGGGCPTYYIDDSLLDPAFDYDFTGKKDDGTVFYRGGKRYYRPYGWKSVMP